MATSYLDTSARYQKAKPFMRGMSAGDSNQVTDDTIAHSRRIISALTDSPTNERLYRQWIKQDADPETFEDYKARTTGNNKQQLRDSIRSYAERRNKGVRVDGTTKDDVITSEETVDHNQEVKTLDNIIQGMMNEKTAMEQSGAPSVDIERLNNNLNYLIMKRNEYSPGKKADVKAAPTSKKPNSILIKKSK